MVADQKSQDASETQNCMNLVPSNSGGSDLTSQGQEGYAKHPCLERLTCDDACDKPRSA